MESTCFRTWFLDKQENSPKKLIEDLILEVHDFEGAGRQADDITLLAINYQASQVNMNTDNIEMNIVNTLSEIDQVNDQFREFASQHELPKRTIATICMVFDELLTNIISYAYQDESEHTIAIKISLMNDELVLVISDDGIPFNPFHMNEPDTNLDIDEREIGGLGIHLVTNMLDQVSYQRNINENMVTLIKAIEPANNT